MQFLLLLTPIQDPITNSRLEAPGGRTEEIKKILTTSSNRRGLNLGFFLGEGWFVRSFIRIWWWWRSKEAGEMGTERETAISVGSSAPPPSSPSSTTPLPLLSGDVAVKVSILDVDSKFLKPKLSGLLGVQDAYRFGIYSLLLLNFLLGLFFYLCWDRDTWGARFRQGLFHFLSHIGLSHCSSSIPLWITYPWASRVPLTYLDKSRWHCYIVHWAFSSRTYSQIWDAEVALNFKVWQSPLVLYRFEHVITFLRMKGKYLITHNILKEWTHSPISIAQCLFRKYV